MGTRRTDSNMEVVWEYEEGVLELSFEVTTRVTECLCKGTCISEDSADGHHIFIMIS